MVLLGRLCRSGRRGTDGKQPTYGYPDATVVAIERAYQASIHIGHRHAIPDVAKAIAIAAFNDQVGCSRGKGEAQACTQAYVPPVHGVLLAPSAEGYCIGIEHHPSFLLGPPVDLEQARIEEP